MGDLREAIERLSDGPLLKRISRHNAVQFVEDVALVVAGARRALEAEEVQVCKPHLSMWVNDDVGCEAALSAQVKPWRDSCRIVRAKLLVDPQEGESE